MMRGLKDSHSKRERQKGKFLCINFINCNKYFLQKMISNEGPLDPFELEGRRFL